MPIEVTAKLVRGPVYLAGEIVECHITFTKLNCPEIPRDWVEESLAWASAQIHCQCTTNSNVAYPDGNTFSAEELSTSNIDTSFAPCRGERGHVVLSTKPRILFCDMSFYSGESQSYSYREVLPSEAPPSYRGQAVKYSYKITIGMQRVNCPIKLLQVPLRVLVVNGFRDVPLCSDSEELAPNNPFLEIERKESPFELALQALQNLTAKRSPNFYNITKSQGKVVRFCLFKQAYKLGEDIVGTFDFSEATVPCVQYSVVLQSEEEIAEGCRRWANQGSAVMSYTKYHEVCYSLKHSHLILPIPLHITPGFATDLVKLQWRLRFEFVTSVPQPETEEWRAPAALNIETMVWNLPIKIYPTTPFQISQGLQTQSKPRIIICDPDRETES